MGPARYLARYADELDLCELNVAVHRVPHPSEAERLLWTMREFARSGVAVLFITHRLEEVRSVADRATVLRDGEVVGVVDPKTTSVVDSCGPQEV
jgi:ABC-type uncharacterized transport system ATPase subunit